MNQSNPDYEEYMRKHPQYESQAQSRVYETPHESKVALTGDTERRSSQNAHRVPAQQAEFAPVSIEGPQDNSRFKKKNWQESATCGERGQLIVP